MELWIRSQDRTFLRKVNTIGIVEGRDFWFISENLTIDFGTYKSKERALEILDEIQQRIIELDKAVIYPHMPEEDYLNVYEMPEV